MTSVRVRLIGFNVVLVAACLFGMGLAVRSRIETSLYAAVDRELREDLRSVSVGAPQGQTIDAPSGVSRTGSYLAKAEVLQVLRTDTSEVRLKAESQLPKLFPLPLDPATPLKPDDPQGLELAKSGSSTHHIFRSGGHRSESLSLPLREGKKVVAVAQATRSLEVPDGEMRDLDRVLETLFPLGALIALGAGILAVRITLRPVRQMDEAAETLSADLSGVRLPEQGNDELGHLAKTLNQAMHRTAGAFASQREAMAQLERFTADAGHELRTPLGAMKGSTSYLLHMQDLPEESRNAVRILDRSCDRMAKLIDDLLLLARQDSGSSLPTEQLLALQDVFDEVLENLVVPGTVRLSTKIDPIEVESDPDGLGRIFTNLLTNAIRYAKASVEVTAIPEGSWVTVTVRDDGEGIAPQHVARLGERFYRPENSRSRERGGVGLGLAIVKSLCESIGAQFEIRSEVGGGTWCTVRLPFRD